MKRLYTIAISLALFAGCGELDDAPLSERTTFMHFYEGAYSLTAAAAEIAPDGYVIVGTVNVSGNTRASRIIVIKTNRLGQRQWERVIDNGVASGIRVLPNGYAVIGSNAVYNANTGNISELENYSARLVILDAGGNVVQDISSETKTNASDLHIDYYGDAITEDNNGNLITLGTYQEPGKSEYSYVTALSATTFDTLWHRDYNYIVRDYVNTKSVHYNGGKVLWGSSITETLNAFNYSYLAIPIVVENSTFVNSNYFGQNQEQQSLRIRDIRESALGYGAIGTYSKPDGTNADMFFIRVDRSGNFIQESIRYFDAQVSMIQPNLTEPSLSDVTESGEALTPTRDGGFVLAGTLVTDEGKRIGNGGNDVWLIKVDAFGVTEWSRIMGGPTSEMPASIRETEDGGLLICGTIRDGNEQSGGLSSIFLMRTDSRGDMKK